MRRQPDRVILSALAAWMAVLGLLLMIGTASLIATESRPSTAQAAVRPAHPLAAAGVAHRSQVRVTTQRRGAVGRSSAGQWTYVKGEVDRCLGTYGDVMSAVAQLSATRPHGAVIGQVDTTGAVCGQVARTLEAVSQHGAGAAHPEILWLSRLAHTVTIDMQRLHRAAHSNHSWHQTIDALQRRARDYTPVQTFRAREGRWLRRLTAS